MRLPPHRSIGSLHESGMFRLMVVTSSEIKQSDMRQERRPTYLRNMQLPGTVKGFQGTLGGCTLLVDGMNVPECVTSLLDRRHQVRKSKCSQFSSAAVKPAGSYPPD